MVPPPPTGAAPECAADADCVAVASDCCGCTAGGAAIAVARSRQPAYAAGLRARCGASACITVMSTDPSCSARPRCGAGACRLE
jgi:hypothetical protein